MQETPNSRIAHFNSNTPNERGEFVLYWMVAARRTSYNFALQHAVEQALHLGLPLVILEALRADYPWASARHHSAIIAGMRDNEAALARYPVRYYPYVEPKVGDGKGLLEALARLAALVVTDDAPIGFLPRMQAAAARKLSVPLVAIDGNGIYPMRATDRVFTTAASFRRHLQKELPEHIGNMPRKNPLARSPLRLLGPLPESITKRWPRANLATKDLEQSVQDLDLSVEPVKMVHGPAAAQKALRVFLDTQLGLYPTNRNQPEAACQSYLSPHLHYGHISSHEVFLQIANREDWSPARLADKPTGSRQGWWGASEAAEAFFDQLITWRELGFNMAHLHPEYTQFESLPQWALTTLEDHRDDVREYQYTLEQFENSGTHDSLWNAAQTQLRTEGIIHNYLRMLWGKKILEWSSTPRAALQTMIHLNNKYASDGRDPNSYSGIFWVLGRYDRAWGPERPIFGKVRYMSSANTARKVRVHNYLRRYLAE